MGFNCLKATEPLRRDSLLFTTRSPGLPGTQLVNLRRMKGRVDLGATQRFWTQDRLPAVEKYLDKSLNRTTVDTETFDPMLFQFGVTTITLIKFTQISDLNKIV